MAQSYSYGYRGRRRRRRNAFFRNLLILLLVFLAAGGIVFAWWAGSQNSWKKNSYSAEGWESGFLEELRQTADYVPGFAADLCVAVEGEAGTQDSAVNCEAGALFNLTDATTVYGKNMFERMYPASITKVMTAILAIESGNPDDPVTCTNDVLISEAGASMAGINPGDTLTLRDLLYGLMIPSGNDAANAIAVHMAGSTEAFAEMMNKRARELGAVDTHFVNANGLHSQDHYTTVYDLYLIFNRAMKLPLFREIIGSYSYTANYTDASGQGISRTWKVGNWYLAGKADPPHGVNVLGGKTGTTMKAGYCLITGDADSSGKEYISVVLKASDRNNLYDNMTRILTKIVEQGY